MKKLLVFSVCLAMVITLIGGCAPATNGTVSEPSPVKPSEPSAAPAESNADSQEPYYIGLSIPLTGSAAVGGNYQEWASQLAVDEINAKGGINGRKLELVVIDDAEDVSQAPIVAQKLCDDPRIIAVIAHSASSMSAVTQPIFEAAKLTNISSCSSVSTLSSYGYEYWFRTCVGNASLCPSMAAFAKNNLGKSKFAIVFDNGENGVTMKDAILEASNNLGGIEIVAQEAYNTGTESDFSTIITKVKNSGADCLIYQGNYTDGGAFLRQMHDLGLTIPVVSLSWLTYSSTLELAGIEAAQNLYCCVAPSAFGESAHKQQFLKSFQEKFGADTIPTLPAMLNYDCIYIIAQAIEEGATKENLAQWVKNVPGLHDGQTFTIKNLNFADSYTIAPNGDVGSYEVSVIGVNQDGFYGYGKVDMTGLE